MSVEIEGGGIICGCEGGCGLRGGLGACGGRGYGGRE